MTKNYALHLGYGIIVTNEQITLDNKTYYGIEDLVHLWNVPIDECIVWDETIMKMEDYIHLTAPQDKSDVQLIESFISINS